MLIGRMIEDNGEPSAAFQEFISGMVSGFITARQHLNDRADFYVLVVQTKDDRNSYWGLIDFGTMPEEDATYHALNHFYAATRMVGEMKIRGFGIIDLETIRARKPIPILMP